MPSAPTTSENRLREGGSPSFTPSVPPPQKRNMLVRYVVLVLVLLAVGFAIWRIRTGRQLAAADAAQKQTQMINRPTPVQITAVQQRTMPIFLSALGNVTPYNTVTLKARVSGELTQINFTEGQNVRQGETLMVIDPRPYQAALDQARGQLVHDQALLKNATAEFARYQALFKAGVVSKESLDSQESTFGQYQGAIKSDEAAIETADLNVKYCTITSPINGQIGLRLVDRETLSRPTPPTSWSSTSFNPSPFTSLFPKISYPRSSRSLLPPSGYRLKPSIDRTRSYWPPATCLPPITRSTRQPALAS